MKQIRLNLELLDFKHQLLFFFLQMGFILYYLTRKLLFIKINIITNII